jgi:hypothetical protein
MTDQVDLFGNPVSTGDKVKKDKSTQDPPQPTVTPTPEILRLTLKDAEDKHFAISVSSDHIYWVFAGGTDAKRALWGEAEHVELLLRQKYLTRGSEVWLDIDGQKIRAERIILTRTGLKALRRWSHLKGS